MRSKILCFALVIIGAGCNGNESKTKTSTGQTANTEIPSQENLPAEQGEPVKKEFWEKLVMHELRDQNGTIAAVMPFPSSWKLVPANAEGVTITGPNGIKVNDFPIRSFMFNYDPSLQGAYSAGGQQMREMPGVEQLIKQDLIPWGNSQGMRFVRYEELPEISRMDKWYSDQLYKAMPAKSDVAAFGIEWKRQDGSPYYQVLHINVSTSQSLQTWYYIVSGLEAEPAYFDKAKKQYLFGLSNMRYNLQPIMVYNQQEAQRVGQSWAAHNQRMIRNQANFEASQRAFVNKSNAINDAIMSGWRERNASSDKNQEQFIDNIYERTNVVDPSTGAGYKVSAGSNNYWMNSNGEYIGTQLQDYNPNLDKNMNEQRWQELKLKDQ